MSQRVYLTKTFIEAAKRTPATGRIEYRDAEVRGLLLRCPSSATSHFRYVPGFPARPIQAAAPSASMALSAWTKLGRRPASGRR